jgi:invasion protein IalB
MIVSAPRGSTLGRAFAGSVAQCFAAGLLALAFAAFAASAGAQQTPPAEGTEQPGAEQPGTEQPGTDQPAAEQPATDPNARLGEKFGDWQTVCEKRGEGGTEVCGAIQEVKTKEGKLALWAAFGYLQANAGPVMIFRIPYDLTEPPSGFRVAKGATIAIDGGTQVDVPIEICAPGGCQVGILLEDAFVTALKAGNKLNLTVPLASGQSATINLSLKGFTAAYDSMKKPS